MQFVCPDDDGDWYYYPDSQRYERLKDGEMRGRVRGKNIPNPHVLARNRKVNSARPPTEATYKLWEHWNAQEQIAG